MLISCLIAAAPLLGATAADDAFALRASHVHVGDGQVVLDAFVVVEDGVVKSVSNNAPRGVRVVEVDGHIAPGFISLRETLGAGSGELGADAQVDANRGPVLRLRPHQPQLEGSGR